MGVEHLLRDIKDASQGQLSKQVIDKINGLKALAGKLGEMRLYLENVINQKYKYNHAIIQSFQDIFNLLPNFNIEEMIKAFSVKSNDYMYVMYVCSLIKSVISLHSLINNKIQNKEGEIDKAKKEEEEERLKKELEMEEKEEKEKKRKEAKDKKDAKDKEEKAAK